MRRGNGDEIERLLRVERAEPSQELLRGIEDRIAAARRSAPRRAVFVGVLSAIMLAGVGGLSYAATVITQALVAPSKHEASVVVVGLNSSGDQYRPGYGWGDPNHNHPGPPGLKRFGPPLKVVLKDGKAILTLRLTVDEQALLFISVLDPRGKQIVLSRRGKKKTTTIIYRKLIPGLLSSKFLFSAGELKPDAPYKIRIIARDPQGNKSTLFIRFRPTRRA
jgi:hypothetical protein